MLPREAEQASSRSPRIWAEDPAAISYENGLLRAAKATGVRVRRYIVPADTEQTEIVKLIEQINADPLLSALLLLRPLPEGWDEDDVQNTWCILEPVSCSGVSPFEELSGFDGAALHREQGPNMRVVNCKESVSLREKRSKTSARLAKVPLGALVLAFPDAGDENGFLLCMYHNQYGYILAEYLAPVE